MTERSKWALLAGLALLWAWLFVNLVVMEPEPQQVPLIYKSGPVRLRAGHSSPHRQPRVAQVRQPDFQPPKNIFAPLDQPGVRLSADGRPSVAERSGAQRKVRTAFAKKPPPTLPTEAPAPPPPPPGPSAAERAAQLAHQQLEQYRFLGYLVRHGEPVAFIEKGREIYIVKTGDRVDRTVEVKAIDPASVKLMEATTAIEATLPLTKDGTRSS